MMQQVIRYSEAFKLQVVSALENGELKSVAEARQRYGISGEMTVQRWLMKYGRDHLRNRIIRVETPKDIDQIKALKKRIRDLEKALAATQVKAVINEAYFQIVCEQHGIDDPEALKKKLDTKL
jgi:transposase-like protein